MKTFYVLLTSTEPLEHVDAEVGVSTSSVSLERVARAIHKGNPHKYQRILHTDVPELDDRVYIWHPTGSRINHQCKRGMYSYEKVAMVHAKNPEDAFRLAQSENSDYELYKCRSTCIGDVIQIGDIFHMVLSIGFIEVPQTVTSFIDWGEELN